MKPALVSDICCAMLVMVSNIITITAIVQTIFDPEYHLSQNIKISPLVPACMASPSLVTSPLSRSN